MIKRTLSIIGIMFKVLCIAGASFFIKNIFVVSLLALTLIYIIKYCVGNRNYTFNMV